MASIDEKKRERNSTTSKNNWKSFVILFIFGILKAFLLLYIGSNLVFLFTCEDDVLQHIFPFLKETSGIKMKGGTEPISMCRIAESITKLSEKELNKLKNSKFFNSSEVYNSFPYNSKDFGLSSLGTFSIVKWFQSTIKNSFSSYRKFLYQQVFSNSSLREYSDPYVMIIGMFYLGFIMTFQPFLSILFTFISGFSNNNMGLIWSIIGLIFPYFWALLFIIPIIQGIQLLFNVLISPIIISRQSIFNIMKCNIHFFTILLSIFTIIYSLICLEPVIAWSISGTILISMLTFGAHKIINLNK